jgi:hypothetical protein
VCVCVACARGACGKASEEGDAKQRAGGGGGSLAPPRLERDALPVASGRECLVGGACVQLLGGRSGVVGSGRLAVASAAVVRRKWRVSFGAGSSCLFFAHARRNGGAAFEGWAVRGASSRGSWTQRKTTRLGHPRITKTCRKHHRGSTLALAVRPQVSRT